MQGIDEEKLEEYNQYRWQGGGEIVMEKNMLVKFNIIQAFLLPIAKVKRKSRRALRNIVSGESFREKNNMSCKL